MTRYVEVVWREIRSKRFRGKNREEAAKRFVNETIKPDPDAEDAEAFDVEGHSARGCWDVGTWEYQEMDG